MTFMFAVLSKLFQHNESILKLSSKMGNRNDLVWAKMRTYPYWPARVSKGRRR